MEISMFELNKIYNFTTLAPVQLGASYKLMKVESIMNINQAIEYRDVVAVHKSVLYLLPSDTPADPSLLTYILFRDIVSGNSLLLAKEWITNSSIVEVGSINLDVKIYNVSTEDISIISKALTDLGYTNTVIKTF